MEKQLSQLREFYDKLGTPYNEKPTLDVSESLKRGLLNMIGEEVLEVREAVEKNDLIDVANELVDATYVIMAAVNVFGLSDVFEDVFDEVHATNMYKLEDGNSTIRHDGKVMKLNGKNGLRGRLEGIVEA